MSPSSSILIGGPLGALRSADLQLAWLDAADDAQDACAAWLHADRVDRADAFVAYRAALDREEAAARALARQTRARSGGLRSS
jgi:hypothetical protein